MKKQSRQGLHRFRVEVLSYGNSYYKLLTGDSALRDRALSSIAPQDRERVRKILKARKDADLLIDVLFADLGSASRELRNNYASQFWRRTAIRALAARAKSLSLVAADVSRLKFSWKIYVVQSRLTSAATS